MTSGARRSSLSNPRINMPIYYHIPIQGHLDQRRSEWLTGMTITNIDDGLAILAGPLADQTALYGVLMKLRDLGR
jgi:hypothetical protein